MCQMDLMDWFTHILGVVTTFSGSTSDTSSGYQDGAAISCRYNFPYGLATEPTENISLADYRNHRLRRVSTNGNWLWSSYCRVFDLQFFDFCFDD